jgi:hypothetical protein
MRGKYYLAAYKPPMALKYVKKTLIGKTLNKQAGLHTSIGVNNVSGYGYLLK